MSEWKTYKLEELCTAKGSYGIAAPAVLFDASKYTYLRITDINDDGTLNYGGLMSVDDKHAGNYLLKENDIVFARTGNSTGRTYFYDGTDGELVYAGFLIKFSLDSDKVNPRILKYYTHSQPYYDWVRSFDTGGTRGNINAKVFGAMPITLPPRNLQDRIVEILKSLDDKIELNRRINANLEEQAQALFNNISRTSPTQKGILKDLIEIKYGKDHKNLKDGNIPVYGSGGIMRYVDTPIYENETVLIPRKGSLNNIIYLNTPFWSVDTMFYSVMKYDHIAKYVYFFLKSKNLSAMNAGSAVPSMTTDILYQMKIDIPDKKVFEVYDAIVSPLFLQIQNNQIESNCLSTLRDILLPKLMKGEIKI
ncbi:restriction endonuclease subunit S [Barnesiella sp. ET7]|uniref:restriction endonuclease subunit S n=1 Tax=Barnesiella sp. ET7 TaxID=2972460 RepID=UPI0021ABB216|nr:restriction endonuclease subunit S [Barnesiella sp. ET7]MCR8911668.1 restriction endonuclease subunit S [Barnesiella sp. ET7]